MDIMETNKFNSLIIKQLTDGLTPEESADLQSWLDESPAHQTLAAELRQVWESAPHAVIPQFSPDLDQAFARVQSKIAAREGVVQSTPTLRFWQRPLVRVAAAVAFLVVAVLAYRQMTPSVEMRMVKAEGAEKKEVKLADGSTVWLRKGAALSYPVRFEGADRCVRLEGEAFFEVSHDPAHHFCVRTPDGGLVEVLGTSFNIQNEANQTSVIVKSGKVRYSPDGQQAGEVLTAGKRAIYGKNQLLEVSDALTFNELSWQSGNVEFVSQPLSDVISELEKIYKVQIKVENEAAGVCRYTTRLSNYPTIEQILESLSVTYNFTVRQPIKGQFILTGGGC
jgi:transmembrane sensor